MRKIFLLTLCIFSLNAVAQPTIDGAATPSIGDVLEISVVNDPTLSQGPAGVDITWDFSNLSAVSSQSAQVIAADNAPNSSSFANASIAIAYSEGLSFGSTSNITHEFFDAAGGSFLKNGFVTNDLVVPYNNPQTLVPAAFTYNDTHSDEFAGTFDISDQSTIEKTGQISVFADAYGSLILPYGTIDDVLRVKITEEYTDKLLGAAVEFQYFIETYAWYSPRFAYPLLVISSEVVQDSPQPAVSTVYYSQIAKVTSTKEAVVKHFTVAPNPTRAFSQLQYELVKPSDVQLSIYNVAGQIVHTVNRQLQAAGRYTESVDFANYPKGMYLVELRIDGNSNFKEKIIVQ